MTKHFRATQPPAGLARFRPCLTRPLSLDGCLRALKTICAASRAPTGGRPYADAVSDSVEHGLTSTVRAALRHAMVDTADVRVALPDLPQHAAAAARGRGHANPSEAASRARRALRLLTGIDPASRKLDSPHLFLSAGFLELRSFARRRQDQSKLVVLARTCAAMGAFAAPEKMPSMDELYAYAGTEPSPYAANSIRNACSAYRRIRADAIRADAANAGKYASLDRRPHWRSRVARVVQLSGDAVTTCHRDRLGLLAEQLSGTYPSIAQELTLYLGTPASGAVSDAWHTAIMDAVVRTVSLLEGLYDRPELVSHLPIRGEVRLWHLFAVDVPLPGVVREVGHADFIAKVGQVARASGPLIKRLMLEDGPAARTASALGGDQGASEHWIPEVCVRNECALWSVVTAVYAEALDANDWAIQVTRRRFVMEWLHASKPGPDVREGTGIDKVWLVTHLSLPLLSTVGLTWMANRAHAARVEWQHRLSCGASDAVCAAAYRRYAFLLHDYCAVAMVCDDGMRRKNYANAQHGRHVTTTYIDGRLVRVDVRFGTNRQVDPASLKISERRRRSQRARKPVQPHVHQLSPTGVDHDLLDWWFREVSHGFTYKRPVCEGTLPPNAAALDGLALFPSAPRSRRRIRVGGQFAARVHEALYDIIRLLHGDAVPARRSLLTRAQKVACTLHRIRLLIGTYWGGARGDWQYAEHLTGDLATTLKEHYASEISAAVMDHLAGRRDDWRHLNHLDDLMDAIRQRRDVVIRDDPRVVAILHARAWLLPPESASAAPRRWRARRNRRPA
ncbi:MAG: hypothetical protein IT355_13200 [Gemmatimonadaceae bacterium]|nr:hypothetical protein [Gemmatimonadaceae bacterium]